MSTRPLEPHMESVDLTLLDLDPRIEGREDGADGSGVGARRPELVERDPRQVLLGRVR
ncbi:hypothetical protein K4X33_03695 [Brevibacterium casei]|nr:hypothetical protein K4X33_03695 [Brevibacterium casei]